MKILIIEDEFSLADAISDTLVKENFCVNIETNGEDGEYEAIVGNYDLILLDIMLPRQNGFEVLKDLRKEKIQTPIIMLTAKSEIDDKLNGLENGANDYITKPFHMRELIARIKVLLKRNADMDDVNTLEFYDLKLNLRTGKITSGNDELIILGKELQLLEVLLTNKNRSIQ